MKKLIQSLLVATMAISVLACSKDDDNNENKDGENGKPFFQVQKSNDVDARSVYGLWGDHYEYDKKNDIELRSRFQIWANKIVVATECAFADGKVLQVATEAPATVSSTTIAIKEARSYSYKTDGYLCGTAIPQGNFRYSLKPWNRTLVIKNGGLQDDFVLQKITD